MALLNSIWRILASLVAALLVLGIFVALPAAVTFRLMMEDSPIATGFGVLIFAIWALAAFSLASQNLRRRLYRRSI